MRTVFALLAESETRYGIYDAAIILLREGLEALLIVGALLAVLKKTETPQKSTWIWGGTAAGVVASVILALVFNLVFSRATSRLNRELVEGVTGLAAGAMLIYVSYWLHSKTSLGAWQRHVHERTTAALSQNRLFALSLVSFLAVFREGAETVLFYAGIAPSIALGDLVVGLALGTAALAVVAVLIHLLGVRVPIRQFFLGTSVLVYYLAFKFFGTGIHALQEAGAVSATPSNYLPESGFFGLYPTWESTVAQAALAVGGVVAVVAPRLRARSRVEQAGETVTAR